MVTFVLAAVVFLAVSLAIIAVVNIANTRRAALTETMEVFASGATGNVARTIDVLRTERHGLARPIDELVKDTSWAERLELEMIRADLPLRPGEYFGVIVAISAVLFAAATLISGTVLVGLLFLPVGYFVIRQFIRHRQHSRLQSFESQLPDAVDLLSTSLKSGFGLLQGMETIARETPRPMSAEFSQVVRNISVGMQLDDALASLCRRIPSDDAYLMVTAILVHRSVGGNLSEVLAGIGRTIRARLLLREEVHALTTDPRVSGYIIGALPFFVFLAISLMNPGYLSPLLTTVLGRLMLITAVVFIGVGLLLMRRFTALDY